MADILVKPVTSRSDQRAFVGYPWKLYRDDPFWIPPIRAVQKELLGFHPHPFHENAEVQAFLAEREGQVCGRIAAIVNHGHNQRYGEQRGFVGFFESEDDHAVASHMFDAAGAWFAERGITIIRGPANPSLNHECGLLVDGFDSSPTFMMTYNPAYYEKLWTAYGFRKVQDLYAYWGHVNMLGGLDEKLQFVVDEASRRFNVKRRVLNTRHFLEDVRVFLNIYNKSLVGTWGFVPLSDSEVEHMARGLRHLIEPDLTSIVEVDGKPIGAVFGLLDFNPRIKKIDGRLFPFGFLQLMLGRKSIKRIRLLSSNVLPEYQKWGIGLVAMNDILGRVLDRGIEEGEFSWVLESNHLSRATLERGGAKRTKTYRMYDYQREET